MTNDLQELINECMADIEPQDYSYIEQGVLTAIQISNLIYNVAGISTKRPLSIQHSTPPLSSNSDSQTNPAIESCSKDTNETKKLLTALLQDLSKYRELGETRSTLPLKEAQVATSNSSSLSLNASQKKFIMTITKSVAVSLE